jgi:hypothetical protein
MADLAYCINLASRADRWASFTDRYYDCDYFKDVKLIKWEATPASSVLYPGSFRSSRSYYAITRDHRLVLEDAWRRGADNLFVFEDDAVLPSRISDAIAGIRADLPAGWLGVWLGAQHRKASEPVTRRLARLRGSTLSHAYWLNRAGIERVFDHLTVRWDWIVDWAYYNLHEIDDRFYAPNPLLVGTAGGWSDHEGREVKACGV